jgi:hypothetical protein
MGRFYQDLDRVGGFDYDLWHPFGPARESFRGPPIDLDKPFVAFIGAAQMLGRFVDKPVSALLGDKLGLPVLNLAVGAAGPRHFDKPHYLDAINRAEAVVVQVLSGRSVSCSLFDNSRDGKHTGTTPLLPNRVRADDFLARAAETLSPDEFARILAEMRADYVERFLALLDKITPPRLLFWFASRGPGDEGDFATPAEALESRFPHLVDTRMVAELAARCEGYVECVSSDGLPQRLWKADKEISGARLDGDTLINKYYPSPEMHREAAERLEAPLRRETGRPKTDSTPGGRFVVVATDRTGTNLLLGMLREHPQCICGGELFNPVEIEKDRLGWHASEDELPGLLEKRRTDPLGLLDELYARGFASGGAAVGFKLMYWHGLIHRPVLDALAADASLKVIHVTRRNLLRRAVSEAQAKAMRRWSVSREVDLPDMPAVELDAAQLLESVVLTQDRETLYGQLFAQHDVLHVVYEDLAARPAVVAERTAAFLGLRPFPTPPAPTLQKTGAESLSDVLSNADALRARFRRWAAYFDQ